jgi:hypothetical protein
MSEVSSYFTIAVEVHALKGRREFFVVNGAVRTAQFIPEFLCRKNCDGELAVILDCVVSQ